MTEIAFRLKNKDQEKDQEKYENENSQKPSAIKNLTLAECGNLKVSDKVDHRCVRYINLILSKFFCNPYNS